jgi:phosphoserine aminotransferase
VFEGITINTPSMLCVEDYLDALRWAEGIGGLAATRARADANAAVLFDWLARTPWVANLAADPATRSNTSVCLRFADPALASSQTGARAGAKIVALLDAEGVAKDIGAYPTAPPGLRIWCGATVEARDLERLVPWLDWAYAAARAALT